MIAVPWPLPPLGIISLTSKSSLVFHIPTILSASFSICGEGFGMGMPAGISDLVDAFLASLCFVCCEATPTHSSNMISSGMKWMCFIGPPEIVFNIRDRTHSTIAQSTQFIPKNSSTSCSAMVLR